MKAWYSYKTFFYYISYCRIHLGNLIAEHSPSFIVNQAILNKPDRLNDEEYAEIKKPTVYGYSIAQAEDSVLADIIISHHERFDGRGYPNGLSGNSIPFLARVIAVADSLDAMGSDRCYRKALPWSVCVSEIRKNDGKMYDPDVVRAFCLSQDEILKFFS